MNQPTPHQQQAVQATGNVLVVAGAGAGKTSTLVERCAARLLDPLDPVGVDRILMVTFTEAAAAEMKHRIRERLTRERDAATDPGLQQHLAEQLALLDTAHIRTLHSFCFELVRQHFHELGIDPQLSVLSEEQGRLLRDDTLDGVLRRHYDGRDAGAQAVQDLVAVVGRGHDEGVRRLVLRVHDYAQTLPDPARWLAERRGEWESAEPRLWREQWPLAFACWRDTWTPVLERQPLENERAHRFAARLRACGGPPDAASMAAVLSEVVAVRDDWPRGTKTKFHEPVAEFYAEAAYLHSWLPTASEADPLATDWACTRGHQVALVRLVEEFGGAFARAKRELSVVDFHDFEQFALRLLVAEGRPTALAREWRSRLRHVFVDEYQDINAAQDAILAALAGEGETANRFLVGDVKQSIYRFRLANPHIFRAYQRDWSAGGAGTVVPLSENFRSREALLDFVNAVFSDIMREGAGGVPYDADAALRFGAPGDRAALSRAALPEPAVELHLCVGAAAGAGPAAEGGPGGEATELTRAEREAALVAERLRGLHATGLPVWDARRREFRPVQWSDMVVLLRSPAGQAEAYAKAFHRAGVPLAAGAEAFFESHEVSDLLSLLQVLDNPVQDVPLLAVLRSPLVGLSAGELVAIRTTTRGRFWTALRRFHELAAPAGGLPAGPLWTRVDEFLQRLHRWRRTAREVSLSQRIELILTETHYLEWVRLQDRGPQRLGNIDRLLRLARQFDPWHSPGLGRFLRFIQAQREAETAPPVAAGETSAVRLLSIHRSKGLEFAVVAVPDLGRQFNQQDLRAGVILDEVHGLCPRILPPEVPGGYPSLSHWLAVRHQRAELVGEELRLLYVALTRARDRLVLTGTITSGALAKWGERTWPPADHEILAATQYLSWLGPWFVKHVPSADLAGGAGRTSLFTWQVHGTSEAVPPAGPAGDAEVVAEAGLILEPTRPALPPGEVGADVPGWVYPHVVATVEPAKVTVTALRRRAEEEGDESAPWPPGEPVLEELDAPGPVERSVRGGGRGERQSAEAAGLAHHRFLELLDLGAMSLATEQALRNEAGRLVSAGALDPAEAALLEYGPLAEFWQSGVGRAIAGKAAWVARELPFTARFTDADLQACGIARAGVVGAVPAGEFLVVQGVADLVVIQPGELWLLDFKTDRCPRRELPSRLQHHAPQVRLYAHALARIYRRPVTRAWLQFVRLAATMEVHLGTGGASSSRG